MPVVPFAATIGAALGTSAAVGGTIAAGTAIAGGLALSQAASQKAALKKAATANAAANGSQVVGGTTPNQTNQAGNLGRAALISTSPSGVIGTDPTGRRKLLGND